MAQTVRLTQVRLTHEGKYKNMKHIKRIQLKRILFLGIKRYLTCMNPSSLQASKRIIASRNKKKNYSTLCQVYLFPYILREIVKSRNEKAGWETQKETWKDRNENEWEFLHFLPPLENGKNETSKKWEIVSGASIYTWSCFF